ncbi:MAG: nicotinate phosphoribosyltransferase [Alphaproteobacteria bacterium]
MQNQLFNNIILNTDSYKTSHFKQYPKGTQYVSSYIESRGGTYGSVIFFGLQAFIKEYLLTPITQSDIDAAEEIISAHGLPFYRQGWEHILKAHNGYLPLEIEAIEEGALIPVHNVLVQVVNTDPQCWWLTSYIETALLRAIWYPTTVASISWQVKQTIAWAMETTGSDMNNLPFKLHDFGARGVSSYESAALGGMAHLVNFQGTDTIAALLAAKTYYNADMAGFSIPAMEHATVTSWGKDGEEKAFANMIDSYAKVGSLLACVSDSYDIFNAVENIWCNSLLEKVKKSGATIVIRPDSGDPEAIILQCLSILEEKLKDDIITNDAGYRMLPDYFRLIQGDGVNPESIKSILSAMRHHGWAADNIAFGMGSALLQKLNRDSFKFAMKCSALQKDGLWMDVYKDPVTDHGKVSKKGRLALIKDNNNNYQTIRLDKKDGQENLLKPIYRDGQLLIETSFDEIRNRASCN